MKPTLLRTVLFAVPFTLVTAACSGGSDGTPFQPAAGVLSPRSDGVANEARPVIRWGPASLAARYRVQLFSDSTDVPELVEQHDVIGATEVQIEQDLQDQTNYSVQVVALNAQSNPIGTYPTSRFKTVILPDWMPRYEVVKNDAALSQGGYRLLNLLDLFAGPGVEANPAMVLVNPAGEVVWYYRHPGPGLLQAPKVLPNGNLLFLVQTPTPTGQFDAAGFEMTWGGQIVWQTRPGVVLHHDILLGPGGNYLYMLWDWKQINKVIYEGDVLELADPKTGQVLWTWSLFDHFPPEQWPTPETQKRGLSGIGQDWSHSNAAVWDPARNLIWMSVRHFDNLVGISYPSGDVEIILGKGGLGGEGLMSHQHAPEVQEDGRILLWDNGNGYLPPYSRATLIGFDQTAGTAQIDWQWQDDPSFFDFAVGDVDRLENGNLLITAGVSGRVIELLPDVGIVWELRIAQDPTRYWFYRALHVPTALIDPAVLPFPE